MVILNTLVFALYVNLFLFIYFFLLSSGRFTQASKLYIKQDEKEATGNEMFGWHH